jgi:hypothetical protein
LPNKKYLSPPNKLFAVFVILTLSLIPTSCQKSVIWGMKREELAARLQRGDLSFLRGIRPQDVRLDEIMQFAPGAAYYAAHMLSGPDADSYAGRLLLLEWQRGARPWKYQAGAELAARYIGEKRYAEAQEVVSSLLKDGKGAFNARELEKLYIETLYWQERDQELLLKLNEPAGAGPDAADPELLLFKAVASCRLGLDGWEEGFRELFRNVPACELHGRAYLFLIFRKDLPSDFTEQEFDIFKAKSLMSEGRYKEAKPLLAQAVAGLAAHGPDDLLNTALTADYGLICLKTGNASADAALIESIARRQQPGRRLESLELAAKIYAAGYAYRKAQQIWSEIKSQAADDILKKRARWYMLKNAIKRGPAAVLSELVSSVPEWKDFDFYSDLLEDYISDLLWSRDFGTLLKLYHVFKDAPPHEIRAQLTYIVLRLAQLGLLKAEVPRAQALAGQLFTQDGFYALLAARFLHTAPPDFSWTERPAAHPAEPTDRGKLIMGFFDYGLYDQGMKLLAENGPLFSTDTLYGLVERLFSQERYLYCMRVLGLLKNREKLPPYKQEIYFLYPLAFKQEIGSAAARYELDPSLFFSLIRRESAFDNTVVSHAGAVGLSQLMPATASDIARRIGLESPDLKDPRQNSLMGAYFFADLKRRFGSIPRALAAYNAGPGRVRGWSRAIGGLPDDLYIQAIPILETRRFVKIVCTGAVYYGILYDPGKSPVSRMLELFK